MSETAPLPECRFRTDLPEGGWRCSCARVHVPHGRVTPATCGRCPWREVVRDGAAVPQPSRGLGDTIARLTKAVGLKPCGGCRQRQQWLNELFPYTTVDNNPATDDFGVSQADLRRTVVVMPVYGQPELTRACLRDVFREPVDVLVVDNQGNYQPLGRELVVRPGENLGWVRGNNLGIQRALATGRYDRCVLLNNDLRLSAGFFAGLIAAERATGASIVAASYDGHWQAQRPDDLPSERCPPAARYRPQAVHRPHGACDGTCVSVHARVVERAGLLDAEHFGRFGWWAMTDWCIRAKRAGLTVAITRAAYCNHLGQQTGRNVHGDAYAQQAQYEAVTGRAAKWGIRWTDLQNAWTLGPLTVYTAITGGRDQLKDPQVRPEQVRWLAFVDDATYAAGLTRGTRVWDVRPIHEALGVPRAALPADPRRAYKPVKCCPTEFVATDRSIWVDASFLVRGDVRQLAWYLGMADLAAFDRNADRRVDCIYEEGRRCLLTDLDDPQVVLPQLDRYRRQGHPEHWGLAWSGCLVRRHTPQVEALGQMWLDEIRRGSKRDQLSLMPLLRRLAMRWNWIPGSIRNNAWLLQDAGRIPRPGMQDAAG